MGNAASGQVVLLVLLVLGSYLLVLRPQRRRVAQLRSVQASLRPGSEVVTAGGLHGRVAAVEGEIVLLEVAAGVQVRVATGAVVRVLDGTDGSPQPPAPAPD